MCEYDATDRNKIATCPKSFTWPDFAYDCMASTIYFASSATLPNFSAKIFPPAQWDVSFLGDRLGILLATASANVTILLPQRKFLDSGFSIAPAKRARKCLMFSTVVPRN